eukprot:g2681.t1
MQLRHPILTAIFLVGASFAAGATIKGYPNVADPTLWSSTGAALKALDAAASSKQDGGSRWAVAKQVFENTSYPMLPAGLKGLGLERMQTSPTFIAFASYFGKSTYAADFVAAAMDGTGDFSGAPVTDKPKEELTMKGTALQVVMAAAVSRLEAAMSQCATAGAGAVDTAAVKTLVDESFLLWAADKGPIALGEKRCPQFRVCLDADTGAGVSSVNTRILAAFTAAQAAATTGSCWELHKQAKVVVSLAYVPVIQGMVREAYEVDPVVLDPNSDGFVEVVEGWAFTAAVLPRIAACSTTAADTIRKNMDTVPESKQANRVVDGINAVLAAVESTYPCLGITCADVSAMVNPDNTAQFLWTPCQDGKPRDPSRSSSAASSGGVVHANGEAKPQDCPIDDSWRTLGSIFIALSAILFVGMLYVLYGMKGRGSGARMHDSSQSTTLNDI